MNTQRDALLQALLQHHVLFFENQPITPCAAARPGETVSERCTSIPFTRKLSDVPEIIAPDTSDETRPEQRQLAHRRHLHFATTPPMGSLLSAKLLPPSGGDTLWSSGIAAYAALSKPFQVRQGLTAEMASKGVLRPRATPALPRRKPSLTRPPRTIPWWCIRLSVPIRERPGRLFVNHGFTDAHPRTQPQAETMRSTLSQHIAKPEFTVRWRWKTTSPFGTTA